jgi:hypothetical protein
MQPVQEGVLELFRPADTAHLLASRGRRKSDAQALQTLLGELVDIIKRHNFIAIIVIVIMIVIIVLEEMVALNRYGSGLAVTETVFTVATATATAADMTAPFVGI